VDIDSIFGENCAYALHPAADIRHLEDFLDEYPLAKEEFVICRAPRKLKLSHRVIALPWQSLPGIFKCMTQALVV